ncbi:MAG: TrkA C-terminal domain-containing protein, partial [Actinomycetota bacterium]|nr:TrkA C-terminal domain-containing protein [Actinomycetota bacterium]
MLAIATVLAALLLSLLITRIATIALSVTGLSRESARFQARSAFTGVGFTTSEAESVVNHPVRRRVVLLLMLLGNAGLVTIVASLLISFAQADESSGAWQRLALLLVGLLALIFLATNRAFDRLLSRLITASLSRFTDLDVRDYAELLQLTGGYGVVELQVRDAHWVANQSLEELQLRREGIAVLGIQRPDRTYTAVPNGASVVHPGDTLVLYGQ